MKEHISTDRGRKICGTCNYYRFESVEYGFMCMNGDSEESGSWVENEDTCEYWEPEYDEEEYGGEDDYIVRTDKSITRLIYEEDESEYE